MDQFRARRASKQERFKSKSKGETKMSHYPPTGKEKEIVLQFIKMSNSFNDIDNEISKFPSCVSLFIAAGHAKEGVKVNGLKDTITALNVYKEIKLYDDDFQKQLKKVIKLGKKVQKLRISAVELMKDFITCPTCHGKKGHKEKICNQVYSEWQECSTCEGRGIIKRRHKK